MTRRTIIDIAQDFAALEDILLDNGGDISDLQVAEAIEEWEAELAADLDGKIDSTLAYIRDCELVIAAKKEEAERLLMGAKSIEKRLEFLKSRIIRILNNLGIKKAGRVRTASVCTNGGRTPIVTAGILNPEDVDRQFVRLKEEVDMGAIREHLEGGNKLPYAELGKRGEHLRIR